ncbi:hypothetical protein DCS_07298 [Drechmeria coniospora]|uniref:Uncharacterized protein n=1 Tax=Drechmeria coniospora TaxID=98403 RepID=A0A151GE20_DRECN|nr:hypothetical protein DCS_07298 [Drechmeria coniospora]KYK55335.1 hypothetical protein DCS_07298 [Drechmeria coniospora]ODA82055.1 hypothetical protein RJ55_00560 [Drechmeria coniospora]
MAPTSCATDIAGGDPCAVSRLVWLGIGFMLGYGTFVVMLGLLLGHQMKRLPWLWDAELAEQRRRSEACAAAAAYVPPPPPSAAAE